MKAIKTKKDIPINLESVQKRDFTILSAILFLVAFFYFFLAANHVLSFQEEQFLFLFTGDYLNGFLARPGGLLEYAGKFLMQFYADSFAGSAILAIVLILPAILMYRILKNLSGNGPLLITMALLPSAVLLLMQNQYYHVMEYNLGFVAILAYFIATFRYRKNYLQIILFPLLWYVAGAFALVFLLLDLVYSLAYNKGMDSFKSPGILLITAFVTFFVYKEMLFFVPAKSLLTYPLPFIVERFHRILSIALISYLIVFPLPLISGFLKKSRQKVVRYAAVVFGGVVVLFATFMLYGLYNPSISSVINIQGAAYKGKWDEVIRINEENPSENLLSQYFYNVALSEKGMLCDRLFNSSQSSGTKSLILPWGDQFLERGAYFFYTAGLVNEAHRWAYEEMVVYGLRPHNLIMLIKTSLLVNNTRMAEKYIGILRKTAFYRDEALMYEGLLGDKEKILSDPELGPIALILPEKDFFIYMDSPSDNLPMLFESNPRNKRAFEYMLGWLLLEKDVETVLSNLHLMKGLGYTRLPRYIEEAVMIYYNSQKSFPEMGGFTVSMATIARFEQYFNLFVQARNNPANLEQTMKERFGDTFWYYYHFKK